MDGNPFMELEGEKMIILSSIYASHLNIRKEHDVRVYA